MDNKKEVAAEGMMGGMMDDMMCDIMDGHTPEALIRKLAEGEKMEAALYVEIARAVPSPELCRIILHKASRERRMAEKLVMLSQCFGLMSAVTPGVAVPYSTGEEKEKK